MPPVAHYLTVVLFAFTLSAGIVKADTGHASKSIYKTPTIWLPFSTTARAITGKLNIAADYIVFENGSRLQIEPITDVPQRPQFVDENLSGQIFRIVGTANPILLNGNKLCGDDRVTYIVLWRGTVSQNNPSLSMWAYDRKEKPIKRSVEECASYNFVQ